MKFNFWLELPTAIISLLAEDSLLEDNEIAKKLLLTSKSFDQIVNKINNNIEIMSSSLCSYQSNDLINSLKLRLKSIENEKSHILIQAMRFTVKLSSKFCSLIENQVNESKSTDNILLTKIKYFLNLIQNSVKSLNYHIETVKNSSLFCIESESELNFCYTLKVYFEKMEAKIYNISLSYLNNSISEYNTVNKKRSNSFLEKDRNGSDPSPFSTPQIKLLKIN